MAKLSVNPRYSENPVIQQQVNNLRSNISAYFAGLSDPAKEYIAFASDDALSLNDKQITSLGNNFEKTLGWLLTAYNQNINLAEQHHGWIQWFFPDTKQGVNPQAPVLTKKDFQIISDVLNAENNKFLKDKIDQAIDFTLNFWGFVRVGNDVTLIDDDQTRITNKSGQTTKGRFASFHANDHNYKRATRFLDFLINTGQEDLAVNFYNKLNAASANFQGRKNETELNKSRSIWQETILKIDKKPGLSLAAGGDWYGSLSLIRKEDERDGSSQEVPSPHRDYVPKPTPPSPQSSSNQQPAQRLANSPRSVFLVAANLLKKGGAYGGGEWVDKDPTGEALKVGNKYLKINIKRKPGSRTAQEEALFDALVNHPSYKSLTTQEQQALLNRMGREAIEHNARIIHDALKNSQFRNITEDEIKQDLAYAQIGTLAGHRRANTVTKYLHEPGVLKALHSTPFVFKTGLTSDGKPIDLAFIASSYPKQTPESVPSMALVAEPNLKVKEYGERLESACTELANSIPKGSTFYSTVVGGGFYTDKGSKHRAAAEQQAQNFNTTLKNKGVTVIKPSMDRGNRIENYVQRLNIDPDITDPRSEKPREQQQPSTTENQHNTTQPRYRTRNTDRKSHSPTDNKSHETPPVRSSGKTEAPLWPSLENALKADSPQRPYTILDAIQTIINCLSQCCCSIDTTVDDHKVHPTHSASNGRNNDSTTQR